MFLEKFLKLILSFFLTISIFFSEPTSSAIFNQYNPLIGNYNFLCGKDYLEVEDLCGVYNEKTDTFYIGKKCGKKEQCLYNSLTHVWQCVKKADYTKNTKKCTYHEECISGECLNSACHAQTENSTCTKNEQCEVGLYCSDYRTCEKYLEVGKECTSSDQCGPRLLCNENYCTEFASLSPGSRTIDPILCTTGLAFSGMCIKVDQDSGCDNNGVCGPLVEGSDGNRNVQKTINVDCNTYRGIKVCPYSVMRQKFFSQYSGEVSNLDPDKFYTNKEFTLSRGTNSFIFESSKAAKYYSKYKNYELLYSLGAFEENGDTKKDFKCVVDFIEMQEKGGFYGNKNKGWLLVWMIIIITTLTIF